MKGARRKHRPAKGKATASAARAEQASHVSVSQGDEAQLATERPQPQMLHKHLRKTRFCMYHLQGACQFGTECCFAHSLAEMNQTPDLRKTQLCKAYQEGACDDPSCTFAHGDEELRSTDMFYKKTLCIWNEKGKCRNGATCRFAHGVKELRNRHKLTAERAGDHGSAAAGRESLSADQLDGSTQGEVFPQNQNMAQWDQNFGTEFQRAPSQVAGAAGIPEPIKIIAPSFENMKLFNEMDTGSISATELLLGQLQGSQVPIQHAAFLTNQVTPPNGSLTDELAQLYESVALLNAQCINIRKRMELEAESVSIQRQAAKSLAQRDLTRHVIDRSLVSKPAAPGLEVSLSDRSTASSDSSHSGSSYRRQVLSEHALRCPVMLPDAIPCPPGLGPPPADDLNSFGFHLSPQGLEAAVHALQGAYTFP